MLNRRSLCLELPQKLARLIDADIIRNFTAERQIFGYSKSYDVYRTIKKSRTFLLHELRFMKRDKDNAPQSVYFFFFGKGSTSQRMLITSLTFR